MKKINKYWTLSITILIFFVTCSPKRGYEVKSFFFDGVPDPFKKEEEVKRVVTDSLTDLVDYVAALEPVKNEPEWYTHKPWADRTCEKCHDQGQMGKLNVPLKDLCFNCHEDFNRYYPQLHGPVASANCTACHEPHKSRIAGLLLEENNDLCLKCHDQGRVESIAIHTGIEEKSCVSCHNPHGGQNKYLLQPKSCYECHDNYEDKFEYTHGPVQSGTYCFTCHDDHSSDKPKLLLQSGNELCLTCHHKDDVYNNVRHIDSKSQNCTSCHDPHASNDINLLTQIP